MLNALKSLKTKIFSINARIPGISHPKFKWKHLYFGIFLIPLVVNPFTVKPFEVPKQSWMMFFIAVFLLIAVIAVLASKKWHVDYNKWVLMLVGLWLLSYALSTIFALAPIEAFWGDFERMSGFLTNFYLILHFLICLKLFKGQYEQDKFINLAIILGCILSFHAILQWLRLDPIQFGSLDEFSGRSYATIGQPSLFGQWLIAPLFAAGFKAFNSEKARRITYICATVLISGGLILSLNRASILAVIITFGLILLYKHKITPPKKIAILSAVAVLGIILIIVFGGSLRSFYSRINLWETSLPLVTNNILIGSGLESYYQTIQTVLTKDIYLTETMYTMPGNVHMESLQVLLDRGLFGLIPYLIGILFLGWVFFKEKAVTLNSKIALFTLIASIISLQFSFAEISQIVYMLALWAILLTSVLKFRTIKAPMHISLRLTAFVLIVAFSGFSFYHIYSISRSNRLMTDGVNQYFTDYNEAYLSLEEAAWQSPNYVYLHSTAVHFLASSELKNHPELQPLLQENLKKMEEITNQNFKYQLAKARLSDVTGNLPEAYKNYKKAQALAPNSPLVYQQWGESAYNNKDYQTAVMQYEKLMNLAPYYWLLPTPDSTDKDYDEKHRIFKKTHGLFYDTMKNLLGAYGATYRNDKAGELLNQLK